MLEGHGDDLYRYAGGIRINFSSNVRPGGPPSGLARAIQERFDECSRYPHPEARSLAEKIALFHGVDPDSVMVTSGSVEAIHLLGFAFRRGRGAVAIPTFSEYADACRIHELKVREVLRGREPVFSGSASDWFGPSLPELRRFSPNLFFICNPNNPTGELLSLAEIRRMLDSLPDTYFVLDEAYIDFIPGQETRSALSLLREFPNLVVVRSLTKSFAIPGIRLGYMIAAQEILERVRPFRTPWSVAVPAIIAGEFILENREQLRLTPEPLIASRESLSLEIGKLSGYRPAESRTHYLLVQTGRGTAADLKEYLAEEKGILIRDASNFSGLGPAWFRIAARSDEENRELVAALDSWRG